MGKPLPDLRGKSEDEIRSFLADLLARRATNDDVNDTLFGDDLAALLVELDKNRQDQLLQLLSRVGQTVWCLLVEDNKRYVYEHGEEPTDVYLPHTFRTLISLRLRRSRETFAWLEHDSELRRELCGMTPHFAAEEFRCYGPAAPHQPGE